MDTRDVSLIKLNNTQADIVWMANLKLVQLDSLKILVKEIPRLPMVECNLCDEYADVLLQVVTDNRRFSHFFSCFFCQDKIIEMIRNGYLKP